jgi:hypothetical protein
MKLIGQAKSAAMARAAQAEARQAMDKNVESDRQKWVATYVDQGLPLAEVLKVFAPFLEVEISTYYRQAQANQNRQNN